MRKNPYGHLLASDLTTVIDNTIFSKETDRDIAVNIFVKSMTVEKCAMLVGYDWKTVQKRLPGIEEKIANSLKKYRF